MKTPGFSLLEVLIALIILGIGLLGIAKMLLITHKSGNSSYVSQQAVHIASNIIDRMHTNRQVAINGNYNVNNLVSSGSPTLPGTPSKDCGVTTCNSTELATYDTWYWLTTDVSQLPNGCASIVTTPSGTNTLVTVTVQWDERPTQSALGISSQYTRQFIVQTEL